MAWAGFGNRMCSAISFLYAPTFFFRSQVCSHVRSQFRELQGSLAASPFDEARVIWCSSLEASPKFYDSEDWQLRLTEHSYESSKYQIDLIGTVLDRLAAQAPGKQVRHLVSEPGACSTSISNALIGPFLDRLKVLAFYIVRRVLWICLRHLTFFHRHGCSALSYTRYIHLLPRLPPSISCWCRFAS
jgi:hypothetical protein